MTGFGENNADAMRRFKAGDEVSVDNSIYLASQTYHRHQVPDIEEYPVFAQFCVGGEPIYPQRPEIIGMKFAQGGGGSIQSGRFAGKMIVVEAMMDETCSPWQADWYRSRVQEALGDALDEHYRVWFIEHAMHTSPNVEPDDPRPVRTTRAVSYAGVLQQALRDLSDWVEHGRVPPASSEYEVVDGQIVVPPTASERKSIQAVVTVDRQRWVPGRGRGRRGRRVLRRRRGAARHGHDRHRRVGLRGRRGLPAADRGPRRLAPPASA